MLKDRNILIPVIEESEEFGVDCSASDSNRPAVVRPDIESRDPQHPKPSQRSGTFALRRPCTK